MRDLRTGMFHGARVATLASKLSLAVGFLLAFLPAAFCGNRDAQDPKLYDIVAVGRGRGQVVLATVAAPPQKLEWRFRKISVRPADKTVAGIVLSVDGTMAMVDFGDGMTRVLDLTKRITTISAGDTIAEAPGRGFRPQAGAKPAGSDAGSRVAALRDALGFGGGSESAPGSASVPAPGSELEQQKAQNDSALDTLVRTLIGHLDRDAPGNDLSWSFFRVTANAALYAPVLEFADGEPDYPSNADLWTEIKASAHGDSIEDYRQAYASLGERRWSRCTYYVRTLSYPGTWLIEYWFYYPFDEGRTHPHIHDSEHLFVEVDKLGGTVRNVFASDHDSFVPNNLYSTLVNDAPPVALPLFAMVELGKHAMAPDMDHDGRFVRGVDDNLHTEAYSYWGLRDRSTKFHFLMEPYLSSMSLPRSRDGRFALADAAISFPGLDVPADHMVCTLQPLPDDPPCANCEVASENAAIAHLVDHPDARNPEEIYKPYVLPWHEWRFGVGIFDWAEGRGELSLAYAGDFRHMTGGLLPVPLRLALEYGWTPFARDVPVALNGEKQFLFSRSTMYAGARAERMITNTQGFYFAATPKFVDISERAIGGMISPAALHWQYGGVSYHAGYVLELPSAHKGNLTQHIGALIGESPIYPVLFEWRVSIGFLRQRGRHDFGARVGDRNPYE